MVLRKPVKCLVFTAIMSAIGNVLSAISILLFPIVPTIPIGAITFSISLDLSHLATFVSAIQFGPSIGGLTGLVSGLVASYEYGFSKGNIINGIAIPPGKAITGIIAGLLFKAMIFRKNDKRYLLPFLMPVAYIPEAAYTSFVFLVITPQVSGLPSTFFYPILVGILIKAWIEMFIIGLLITAIINRGVITIFKKDNLG